MSAPTRQVSIRNQGEIFSLLNDSVALKASTGVDLASGLFLAIGATYRPMDCSDLLPHLYTGCRKPRKGPSEKVKDASRIRVEREFSEKVESFTDVSREGLPSSRNEVVAFFEQVPGADADVLERRTAHLRGRIRFYEALLVYSRHTMLGIVIRAFLPGFITSVTALHTLQEQAFYIKQREEKNGYTPFMDETNAACTVDRFEKDVMELHRSTTTMAAEAICNMVPAAKYIPTHFPVWGKKLNFLFKH